MMKKRILCVFLVLVLACSLMATAASACEFPVWDKSGKELVTISVSKVWDHGENEDKPTQATIQLLNGNTVVDTVVLTAADADGDNANVWKGAFKPVAASGSYTVKEVPVEGYETAIDQPEISPMSVTGLEKHLVSFCDKEISFDGNLVVSFQGGFYYVWTPNLLTADEQKTLIGLINQANLPCLGMGLSSFNTVFNCGKNATYWVPVYNPCSYSQYALVTVGSGAVKFCQNMTWSFFYAGEYETAKVVGATVTNTYVDTTPIVPPVEDETVDVTGEVAWAGDTAANRPGSVQLQLYKDGEPYGDPVTVDADCGWTYVWEELDAASVWSVDETAVPNGYTKSVSNSANTWKITNTLIPVQPPVNPPVVEDETVDVTAKIVWENDTAEDRPDSVEIQLYRDGKPYGDPVVVDKDDNWKYVWRDLDDDYSWSVDGVAAPAGYEQDVSRKGNTWTITNTLLSDPEVTVENPDVEEKEPEVTEPEVTEPETERPADDVPATGDNSSMALWIALTCLSLVGMAALQFAKKRSRSYIIIITAFSAETFMP